MVWGEPLRLDSGMSTLLLVGCSSSHQSPSSAASSGITCTRRTSKCWKTCRGRGSRGSDMTTRRRRTAPLGCSRQSSSLRPGSSQTSHDLSTNEAGQHTSSFSRLSNFDQTAASLVRYNHPVCSVSRSVLSHNDRRVCGVPVTLLLAPQSGFKSREQW